MNKILIIVDPQYDFIDGGALPVKGGEQALINLTEHVGSKGDEYEKIIVSLDTHNPTNLGFKENWTGPSIEKVVPGSLFPKDKINRESGVWPTNIYTAEKEVKNVIKQPDFMCWPKHCLKNTKGWQPYTPLWQTLQKYKNKVDIVTKGENDSKDCYSMMFYGDLEITEYGRKFKTAFSKNSTEAEFYFAGLATDYCVLETIRGIQILTKDCNCTYNLFSSMTESINTREVTEGLIANLPSPVKILL